MLSGSPDRVGELLEAMITAKALDERYREMYAQVNAVGGEPLENFKKFIKESNVISQEMHTLRKKIRAFPVLAVIETMFSGIVSTLQPIIRTHVMDEDSKFKKFLTAVSGCCNETIFANSPFRYVESKEGLSIQKFNGKEWVYPEGQVNELVGEWWDTLSDAEQSEKIAAFQKNYASLRERKHILDNFKTFNTYKSYIKDNPGEEELIEKNCQTFLGDYAVEGAIHQQVLRRMAGPSQMIKDYLPGFIIYKEFSSEEDRNVFLGDFFNKGELKDYNCIVYDGKDCFYKKTTGEYAKIESVDVINIIQSAKEKKESSDKEEKSLLSVDKIAFLEKGVCIPITLEDFNSIATINSEIFHKRYEKTISPEACSDEIRTAFNVLSVCYTTEKTDLKSLEGVGGFQKIFWTRDPDKLLSPVLDPQINSSLLPCTNTLKDRMYHVKPLLPGLDIIKIVDIINEARKILKKDFTHLKKAIEDLKKKHSNFSVFDLDMVRLHCVRLDKIIVQLGECKEENDDVKNKKIQIEDCLKNLEGFLSGELLANDAGLIVEKQRFIRDIQSTIGAAIQLIPEYTPDKVDIFYAVLGDSGKVLEDVLGYNKRINEIRDRLSDPLIGEMTPMSRPRP